MSVAITKVPAGTASVPILLSDLSGTPSQGADTRLNAPTYYDVKIGSISLWQRACLHFQPVADEYSHGLLEWHSVGFGR